MLLLCGLLVSVAANELTTTLSSRSLSVGDHLDFRVTVAIPKSATVTPPIPEVNFGSVIVKEWNVKKSEHEALDSLIYSYIITTYSPEPCTIPALSFAITSGETLDTLHTVPLPLEVISVVTSDSADIKDMIPPRSTGKAPQWWLWLLGSAAAVVAAFAGIRLLLRKLHHDPVAPPPQPPYEEALDALRELAVQKFLQRGLIREYVFELSEIFKRYIGRRFACNAVEYTTEELFAWLGASGFTTSCRASVEWFFRTTDPIKFARLIPDQKTLDRFEQEVRTFLEETKPVINEEPQPATVTNEQSNKPNAQTSTPVQSITTPPQKAADEI